jgi:putative two-component system hydrogenase maturation factor HypX/HoxX
MRILLLTHTFNSLSQRIFVELARRGHELSVEYDISDAVTTEAVALFQPALIVAPYLKRAIPETVWRRYLCLIVHPGVPGDRGPSALDWAVLNGERRWGVTVLQATGEMDAGPVWAHCEFPMRAARKSNLYRFEVTDAAAAAVLEAVDRFATGSFRPVPQDAGNPMFRGCTRPAMQQSHRRIDWQEDTDTVLRKLHSADGQPGVTDELLGLPCRLFDAHREDRLAGPPGTVIARRGPAICRATRNGAVWIGHVRPLLSDGHSFKLPATTALGERIARLPESVPAPHERIEYRTYREITYEEFGRVGLLHFDFYNGAMGTDACRRLLQAYRAACRRPTRVLVLAGGTDFWSNGIDLNRIEAAASPADESWTNIQKMDDLAEAIITTSEKLTIAALGGNAGAGGAFLALAADYVWARAGAVLNPHYKNMGNLYGSEFWTYLLPRRLGAESAAELMTRRLPTGTAEALRLGLIDAEMNAHPDQFRGEVLAAARDLAQDRHYPQLLDDKRRRRQRDEDEQPLADYRQAELQRMRLNFYGFDPSYHVARYRFVHKTPHAWTPRHLAVHRRLGWLSPAPLSVPA